jgi:hypothetical protein
MEGVDWAELSEFFDILMDTKEVWRKKLRATNKKGLKEFIAVSKEGWEGKSDEDLGKLGRICKERCIELAEMAEAELLGRP